MRRRSFANIPLSSRAVWGDSKSTCAHRRAALVRCCSTVFSEICNRLRNLLLAETINLAQREHLPAARGQLLHGAGQERELLVCVHDFFYLRSLVQHIQSFHVCHQIDRNDLTVPQPIQRDVACNSEAEGPHRTDVRLRRFAGNQKSGVCFLQKLVDVAYVA